MASSYRKKFLSWVRSNPKCSYITEQTRKTRVMFDKTNPDPAQRIKIFHIPPRENKKNIFEILLENIWVPGHKLGGKEWTDRNWNEHLDQTSSIMSFSGIFDMLCMSPILFYLTKGAGLLAGPISLIYGFLLLIISNKAGEFSMNRSKENYKAANFLLIIFVILSLLKTVMSGVGIDIVSRSSEIKNATAQKYLQINKPLQNNNNLIYTDVLISANKECDNLINKRNQLNTSKRGQRKLYTDLQERMYKKPINPISDAPKYLLEKHLSTLGPCLKRDLINQINGNKDFNTNEALSTRKNIIEKTSPVTSLYLFQRNKFNDLFKGNPIIGSKEDYLKDENVFKNSPFSFNIECNSQKEECSKNVSWNNSSKVVNEAWNQFYGRIIDKDYENLGLSYIGFLVSILLSASATVLLYASSTDVRNRASRSSLVKQLRNDMLDEINEIEEEDI